MQNEVLAVLRAARELIAVPAHWTKGVAAMNADGYEVDALCVDATCFCTVGALNRATRTQEAAAERAYDLYKAARERLVNKALRGSGLVDFNDHPGTTHEDVLAMFDAAIAELEGELA